MTSIRPSAALAVATIFALGACADAPTAVAPTQAPALAKSCNPGSRALACEDRTPVALPGYSAGVSLNERGQVLRTGDVWEARGGFMLRGSAYIIPADMNDRGEVAGSVLGGGQQPALWNAAGELQPVERFAPEALFTAINNHGVAAGNTILPPTAETGGHIRRRAFVREPSGEITYLFPESVPVSEVTGINNHGEVVGTYQEIPQRVGNVPGGPKHGFYWSRSTGVVNLGTIPLQPLALPTNIFPAAINDRGEVAGTISNVFTPTGPECRFRGACRPTGISTAFVWSARDGLRELGSLGGPDVSASDINDHGVVLGVQRIGVRQRTVTWTERDGSREVIPADQTGGGREIDNSGDVLGTFRDADGILAPAIWSWKPEHYQP